jgi:hypothetical protein
MGIEGTRRRIKMKLTRPEIQFPDFFLTFLVGVFIGVVGYFIFPFIAHPELFPLAAIPFMFLFFFCLVKFGGRDWTRKRIKFDIFHIILSIAFGGLLSFIAYPFSTTLYAMIMASIYIVMLVPVLFAVFRDVIINDENKA